VYLSCLEVDADTPAGTSWLGDPYRVRQRLRRAFYWAEPNRVLFRIRPQRENPGVLIQSQHEPYWQAAFRDLPVLVTERHRQLTLSPRVGQRLPFRLRAYPMVRLASRDGNGERRMGPRVVLLKEEQQREWLERKGMAGGFRPLAFEVRTAAQTSFARGPGTGVGRQTVLGVDFQGMLVVTDVDAFKAAMYAGIGPGKDLGFGLMTVDPA
jgi:CRISPR system Cascade subunit CasE